MLAESLSGKKGSSSSHQDNKNKENNMNLLFKYCKNINEWPDTWEIDKADIKTGQSLLEEFKLFLINRIEKGQAKKTIKTHADYLWALGGELIRQVNDDNRERRLSARNLILKHTNNSGGPYWRHASNEADHDRYDSTCRQFFKFINGNTG